MPTPVPNPATVYNEKRRIVFSTFYKNPEDARKYLEGYKAVLGPHGYVGLKAELDFLEKYRTPFKLILAADIGDATDFAGQFGSEVYRIDVTTNESFKSLLNYAPFQQDGEKYKIAIMDKANGELIDLVDINLPFCNRCSESRMFDIALLLPERRPDGATTNEFDQVKISYCPVCDQAESHERFTTYGLRDFESARASYLEAQELGEDSAPWDERAYVTQAFRYVRKTMSANIVALAANRYTVTNHQSRDGFWETYLHYVRPLAEEWLPTEFGTQWDE